MTAKQITELHDLCLQINLLAVGEDNAPIVLYMVAGNSFSPQISVSVYKSRTLRKIMNFTVYADDEVDKEYRMNFKKLKDIKKKMEVKENE